MANMAKSPPVPVSTGWQTSEPHQLIYVLLVIRQNASAINLYHLYREYIASLMAKRVVTREMSVSVSLRRKQLFGRVVDHATIAAETPQRRFGVGIALLAGLVLFGAGVTASAAENAGDCTEIDLRFETYDEPLTDAEISELRRRQHEASLNAFEGCVTAASGGSAGGADGGGGNGGGGNSGNGNAGGEGVAASGISGTNPAAAEAELSAAEQLAEEQAEQAQQAEATQTPVEPQGTNGRAPQDIPSADNDSVLAAQIRKAAETESDPGRRAKLWNEYRKIRGLPAVGS